MCNCRATSAIDPDRDGYTVKAFAICSTVRLLSTAIEIGWISSLARGATTQPPTTIPVPGRQKILTKPSRMPCILARGLRSSGSLTTRASIFPASTSAWL
ncbi:hypothetical protein SBADM41S_02665 [Streptomyces badius]